MKSPFWSFIDVISHHVHILSEKLDKLLFEPFSIVVHVVLFGSLWILCHKVNQCCKSREPWAVSEREWVSERLTHSRGSKIESSCSRSLTETKIWRKSREWAAHWAWVSVSEQVSGSLTHQALKLTEAAHAHPRSRYFFNFLQHWNSHENVKERLPGFLETA